MTYLKKNISLNIVILDSCKSVFLVDSRAFVWILLMIPFIFQLKNDIKVIALHLYFTASLVPNQGLGYFPHFFTFHHVTCRYCRVLLLAGIIFFLLILFSYFSFSSFQQMSEPKRDPLKPRNCHQTNLWVSSSQAQGHLTTTAASRTTNSFLPLGHRFNWHCIVTLLSLVSISSTWPLKSSTFPFHIHSLHTHTLSSFLFFFSTDEILANFVQILRGIFQLNDTILRKGMIFIDIT